jgi:hypothetical protein
MTTSIVLPSRIDALLRSDSSNYSLIIQFLTALENWITSRPQTFFPDYTEHGASHINRVLSSSTFIISESAWQILTSDDMVCLVLAACAHDVAMFFSPENLAALLLDDSISPLEQSIGDLSWKIEWDSFLLESKYLDDRQLNRIFGRRLAPRTPSDNSEEWTKADYHLIGEFIRRKHGRIGSEVITKGIPFGARKLSLANPTNLLADRLVKVSGLIARSHSLELRLAADLCRQYYQADRLGGAHVTFLMAVLRIADSIHVGQDRARSEWLRYRTVENAFSRDEWVVNQSVASVQRSSIDPEALEVLAYPTSPKAYRALRSTLRSIQYELDKSWAILGEIYSNNTTGGRSDLGIRGLTVRRIRSNIDTEDRFQKSVGPSFPSGEFVLGVDDVRLMLLLVEPLYNYDESFAIRELLQNGLDAIKERCSLDNDFLEVSRRNETIRVFIDTDEAGSPSRLRVVDDGIGMNTTTIGRYFLRIGSSFGHSPEWVKLVRATTFGASISRTGRFGVGVMAAFLLGDEIRVTTRHCKEDIGYSFSVRLEDRDIDLMFNRAAPIGTSIAIELRDNIKEKWKVLIKNAFQSELFEAYPIRTHYFGSWPLLGCYISRGATELAAEIKKFDRHDTVPSALEDTDDNWWFFDLPEQGRIYVQTNKILGNGQVAVYVDGMEVPETNVPQGVFLSGIGGLTSIAVSLSDPNRRLRFNLNRTRVFLPDNILEALETTFCEDVIARWLAEDISYFDHTGGARSPVAFSKLGFIPLTAFGLHNETLIEVVLRPGFLPSRMAPRSVASHPSAIEKRYRELNHQIIRIFEECSSRVWINVNITGNSFGDLTNSSGPKVLQARVAAFAALSICENAVSLGEFRALASSGRLVNASSLGLSLVTPQGETEAVTYPALICRAHGQIVLDENLANAMEQLMQVEGVHQLIVYQMSGSVESRDYGLLQREFLRIFGHEGIPVDTQQRRRRLQSPKLEQRVGFYRNLKVD